MIIEKDNRPIGTYEFFRKVMYQGIEGFLVATGPERPVFKVDGKVYFLRDISIYDSNKKETYHFENVDLSDVTILKEMEGFCDF